MRILWLADFYPPHIGGMERHVQMIGNELSLRGHEVAVATIWHPGTSEFELDGHLRVYRFKGLLDRLPWLYSDAQRRFHPTSPDPMITSKISRIVETEKPQIVIVSGWILYSFLPIVKRTGAKLIVRHHDYAFICPKRNLLRKNNVCSGPGPIKCYPCAADQYGWLKGSAINASFRLSSHWHHLVDGHIAVSKFVANAIEQSAHLEGQAMYVVPAPIPDEVFDFHNFEAPLDEIPAGEDFILFVGSLTEGKGLNVLLEAYRGIQTKTRLVLVGTQWSDSPADYPDGIIVIKNAPHPMVMNAFYRCLFAVVPSLWAEPFGQVAAEAMAAGKAVVASGHGGLADIVVDRETGILVPPGDSRLLRDAMTSLLQDKDECKRLGLAGRNRAREKFTRSIVTSQIETILGNILSGQSMSGGGA